MLIAAPLFLAAVGGALAYPDAAPWGAAHPDAEEACASCHYDYEAVPDSSAVSLAGLPVTAIAGRWYPLRLRFEDAAAAVSGFQVVATNGRMRSADPDVESVATACRSTSVRRAGNPFEWRLEWQAPETGGGAALFVATSSANDDQSPFGDTIHYRRYDVTIVAGNGDMQ